MDEAAVLDALASPKRLAILRTLAQQPMNYTELMKSVGMTKQKDAGKFSYHLKKLLSTDLVRVNEKTKLYELSKRGHAALALISDMRKNLEALDMLIVRRTELTVEPFDKNKIVNVLINEAGVPPRLANRVASLAEEKLLDLNVEYLSAPLIREIVNSILIDMGLERYRHKLIRVGMPLYDVSRLLNDSVKRHDPYGLIVSTSQAVIREFILFDVLPRNVSDAHITGNIHLDNIGSWPYGEYAKSYSYHDEVINSIVDESLYIDAETGIEIELRNRRELEKLGRTIQQLDRIDMLKKKLVSLIVEYDPALIRHIHKKTANAKVSIVAYADSDLNNDEHVVDELVQNIGQRIALSLAGVKFFASGYSINDGRSISGVAAINLPRLAISSEGDENKLWSSLRNCFENIAQAFIKKYEMLRELRSRDAGGYFVVSGCGVGEALRILDNNKSEKPNMEVLKEIVRRMEREAKRAGRDKVSIVIGSVCSHDAARRMYRIDSSEFGHKRLSEFMLGRYEHYTTSVYELFKEMSQREMLDALADVLQFFAGGFMVSMSGRREAWARLIPALFQCVEERKGKVMIQPS